MSTLLETHPVETPPDSSMMPPFPVRRWTVAEYRQLGELGILTEDDNVELLDGWIVPKRSQGALHEWAVSQLGCVLAALLGTDWILRTQCAIDTSESEPEPDVSIVRAPLIRYLKQLPSGTEEIPLVIEVSDASLAKDRLKAAIYAGDGLPCYLIVNLVDRQIEFHSDPDKNARRYRDQRTLHADDLVPLILGGQTFAELPAHSILPPED